MAPSASAAVRLLPLLLAATLTASAAHAAARSVEHQIDVGGLKRTYRLYVPANLNRERAAPLVLAFHGGGSDAAATEKLTRFSHLAERDGFIVAYPEGIDENWNDGRDPSTSAAHRQQIDDVGFAAALIDTIARDHRIDARRVYATGISNGAIFSHYLAAHLSARIAAIAPVVGGIAEPFDQRFRPTHPVSVFIIQGTDDPLTPYQGGPIARGRRGRVISTDAAAKKWADHNRVASAPRTGTLPDKDPKDGCRVRWSRWDSGRAETEVMLYTLDGAGHTWPGGAQYLPQFVIGKVCRDFDASEAIWDFFQRHPKP